VQEREETSKAVLRVNHSDQVHFVINIHSLHNSLRIRQAIPPDLHSRRTLVFDKEAIFAGAVDKMKTSKAEKTRIAAAKRAAKTMVEEAVAATSNTTHIPIEPGTGMGTETAAAAAHSKKRKNTGSSGSDAYPHVAHRQSTLPKHVTRLWSDVSDFSDTQHPTSFKPQHQSPPKLLSAPLAFTKSTMGYFDDLEHNELRLEEDSDTSSIDEREAPICSTGQAPLTTGCAFDAVDFSGLTPSAALLAFTEACCEEFKLPVRAKEDVMRTATLPGSTYASIRMYARMMEMGLDVSRTQVDEFLKSNTFKETIKRRIQGGLLDPNIHYYVYGCTARFVRHMRANPAAYEIPLVVQEGLMNSKKFSSAVGEILSSFRGELRRKIFGSIEDKTDIATTGEKLAIQGYLLSEDHLKQFALLRRLSEDYNEAEAQAQAKKARENVANAKKRGRRIKIDGGPQKALAFWTYIDSQMFRYRKFSAAERA
ncbi:hypothetical protein FRC11_000350, partial [Ceratobasidium sp. 423]